MLAMTHDARLLLIATLAITGLVVLIARGRLPSFIALTVASLFVGLCSGQDALAITRSFADGVGAVLGAIALVIALGTVLGKMLAVSGGAERIATTLLSAFGERWMPWTMALVAFVVGLPVFFGVGLVLLLPLALTVARQTRAPLLRFGLPLVAGLSVAHGLVPPHPGPIAAVGILRADMGKTIFYALVVGVPTVLVCGPLLGALLARRETVEPGSLAEQLSPAPARGSAPGFGLALVTVLLPVLLMLLATVADVALAPGHTLRRWADWLGDPIVALLVAVLFSFWSCGRARGFDRRQLGRFSEECLAPVAAILLVVGAGGGFSHVLIASGVGDAVAKLAGDSGLSPLLLGWLAAALIRVATGSATVAITTASGLLAPIAAATPGLNRELLVVALGAGSLILSHVNDGGFWLVKEYLNLSVAQTLRTWSVIETAISVTALALVLVLSLVG